jgi:hypothetical protein
MLRAAGVGKVRASKKGDCLVGTDKGWKIRRQLRINGIHLLGIELATCGIEHPGPACIATLPCNHVTSPSYTTTAVF